MILLSCALAGELAFWEKRDDVDLLITGVGPVEAAYAVGRALAARRYALVINAGIAGAFDGAAAIGDGVAIREERYELDLETGDPIVLPDGRRTAETAHSDEALVEGLHAAGFAALRGITVQRVTASETTAARLASLGAQAESMEGFAVLRAAQLAGVRAIEVRGISNRVGQRDQSRWDFDAGVAGVRGILGSLLALV